MGALGVLPKGPGVEQFRKSTVWSSVTSPRAAKNVPPGRTRIRTRSGRLRSRGQRGRGQVSLGVPPRGPRPRTHARPFVAVRGAASTSRARLFVRSRFNLTPDSGASTWAPLGGRTEAAAAAGSGDEGGAPRPPTATFPSSPPRFLPLTRACAQRNSMPKSTSGDERPVGSPRPSVRPPARADSFQPVVGV